MIAQRCHGFLRSDVLHMRVGILHGSVLLQDFRSRLDADSGNTRNIIRGIPHERLQFHNLGRSQSVGFFHVPGMIIRDLRLSAFCPGNPYQNLFCRQLQQIPVAGNHRNVQPLFLRLYGKSSQNIIRLKPFLHDDGNAHGLQHLLHQGNLLPEFLRHGMSCPFIGLVHFVAEGRRVRIESDCQIIRLFLLQNLKKNIQETVNRSCMSPSRCRQIRQTVKGTVQNAVSVNKNDFSAQCFFSVCLVNAAAKRCL